MANPRGCFSVGTLPMRRQGSVRRIDPEAGERARPALGRVEEPAVGRDVKVCGRGLPWKPGGSALTLCFSLSCPVAAA